MNPVFRPLRELADAVCERRVSPVALAEMFLDRLERLGPRYNAVVTLTRERALTEARRAEGEIAAGRWRRPAPRHSVRRQGPAGHGRRHPDDVGCGAVAGADFDDDATVMRRLQEAGAVLVAKLAMVELAGGMGYRQPNASFTGPGISPWGDAWSGGSSSGSGSAVSAPVWCPFAIGSETWGSILSPAAYCGVTGLRPTYGRVSRHGAMALCWTLDKLGPLALTADDCGLVLDAIAGPDPLRSHGRRRGRSATRRARSRPALPLRRRPGRGRDRGAAGARGLRALARGAAQDRHGRGGDAGDLPYEAITRTIFWPRPPAPSRT